MKLKNLGKRKEDKEREQDRSVKDERKDARKMECEN